MNRPRLEYLATFLCLVFMIVGGCNSAEQSAGEGRTHSDSDDPQAKQADKSHNGHGHVHDDSGVPKSLQAAIAKLRDMQADISTAMEKNEPEAAHAPLHKVGKILAAMPDLAAETDLPENEWNEVKAEVDKLFDAFGDIDSAFHKKDGDKLAAYEAAKSTIDKSLAALEAKVQLLKVKSSDSAHDHKGHDHDDHDHHDESSK